MVLNRHVEKLGEINMCIPNNATTCPSDILVGIVPTGVTNIGRVMVMAPPRGSNATGPSVLTTTGVTNISEMFLVNNTRTITTLTCNARSIPGISGVINPNGVFITATGGLLCNAISVSVVTKPDRVLVITSGDTGPGFLTTSLVDRTRRSGVTDTVLLAADRRATGRATGRLSHRVRALRHGSVVRRSLGSFKTVVIYGSVSRTISFTGRLTPRRLRLTIRGPVRCVNEISGTNDIFLNRCSPRPLNSCFTNPGRILPADNATEFFSPLSISDFVGGSDFVCCARPTLSRTGSSVVGLTRARKLATRTGSVGIEFWVKTFLFYGRNVLGILARPRNGKSYTM